MGRLSSEVGLKLEVPCNFFSRHRGVEHFLIETMLCQIARRCAPPLHIRSQLYFHEIAHNASVDSIPPALHNELPATEAELNESTPRLHGAMHKEHPCQTSVVNIALGGN